MEGRGGGGRERENNSWHGDVHAAREEIKYLSETTSVVIGGNGCGSAGCVGGCRKGKGSSKHHQRQGQGQEMRWRGISQHGR